MGQAEIDKDGRLDDRDEDKGQGQALLHQGDDNEDGEDGDGVDHLEVVVRGLDHVLHAGGLADEEARGVIALEDGVQPVHLGVDAVAGHLVLRVDEQELPFAAPQRPRDLLRQEFRRDAGARHALQAQDVLHALHLLHLPDHGVDRLGRELRVHQDHVGGGDAELVR